MCKRDKYGFMIVLNVEDLLLAKTLGEVSVSEKCRCCDRTVVVPLDRVGLSCNERKILKVYSI